MAVKFLKAGKCSLDEIRDIIPELDDNDITEIEHSGSGTQTIRQSTQKHLQNITINYRFYNCYNMIFMLLYLIGVIKFKYYRRMVFMFKKNVIGICVTSIHKPSVHRILAALSKEAGRRGYYIHIFATLSDLYHHTKNDFAQKRIFDLVDYNRICCLVLFTEMIKDNLVNEELARRATDAGVPVICIKQPLEGCCNISYNSEAALGEIIRHLITVHGCRNINFMAGVRGNEVSEARINIYRNVLDEFNISVEEDRIGYGDFWTEPAIRETERFLKDRDRLPDAIVCANDAMAIAVCSYLLKNNIKIPEDIIVTGLGGILEREYHIPLLTSAIYDPVSSSNCIMDTIQEITAGGNWRGKTVVIPTAPVFTESCGCVKSDKNKNDQKLEQLFITSENEHNYNHAIHEFNSFINVDCTLETLANLLPGYLWGPGISTLNLFIESKLVEMFYYNSGINADSHLVLLNQISDRECLTPFAPVQYSGILCRESDFNRNFTDMLLIPLNVMDENLGIITIDYNGKGICYECLYEFIITLDNMLGTIKSRMELISMHQQLNTLSEQTIQSLAEIVEAKSEFTGLHVKRVSEYTRVLAEAMGYTPDEVDTIRVASMMHDIGKINIPSSILEKPGKLTDDEFEVIKTHVTEGEKLLHNSPGRIMQTARIIALQHHERWNGKGYLGIKGTDIALESRIVALADVFDALVSKRPYKTAFSDNTAYDIITKDSGSHFDPDVVDAFVDNYNKFISIHAQYTD